MAIEMRLELVQVPVSDVDRAKAFYVDQVGFNDDHDHRVSDEIRFVQLDPARLGLLDRPDHGRPRDAAGQRSTACRWWSRMPMPPGRSSPSAASR